MLNVWVPLFRSDESKFSEGLILQRLGYTDFWFCFGFVFIFPGASLITMLEGMLLTIAKQ